MKRKNAIATYLIALVLCPVVTAVILWYRGDFSFRTSLDTATLVALGMVVLGALARSGAATGPDIIGAEAVRRTSIDPDAYQAADNDDARRGIAFGWILIAVGATWLALAATAYLVSTKMQNKTAEQAPRPVPSKAAADGAL